MKLWTITYFMSVWFVGVDAQVHTDTTSTAPQAVVVTDDCDEEEHDEYIFDDTSVFTELNIYPTSNSDYFAVSPNPAIAFIYVYNIIGRPVKTIPAVSGGAYDLTDLPDGIYLISLADKDGNILRTIRTNRNRPRP